MQLIKGDKLNDKQRREVLERFVHRWTHENAKQTYGGRCPACEQRRLTGGTDDVNGVPWHDYHQPLTTDAEWLAAHAFYVTKKGKFARNRHFAQPAFLAD